MAETRRKFDQDLKEERGPAGPGGRPTAHGARYLGIDEGTLGTG